MDANQLRFLESAENIASLVQLRAGRRLSTSRAREIAACIQQGRQFFEASSDSPLEIRPLIQFYGTLGFAKALILGKRLCSISALAKGHGLRDVSNAISRVADLAANIEAHGTFCEFNNVVSSLNRLRYIDEQTHPGMVPIPTVGSDQLVGTRITLKDVLARVPSLSKLYKYTFSESPACEHIDQLYYDSRHNYWTTRIFGEEVAITREVLRTLVNRWRARFPYLSRWRVVEATPAWGAAYITLANLERGDVDDLDEAALREVEPNRFSAAIRDAPPPDHPRIPLDQLFLGIGGGYSGSGIQAIEPYNGVYISEFSIAYIGLFLLSSLVRYRPDIWSHAVSRSSLQNRPVDDKALALIEAFLETTQGSIPDMVVKALNPHEDRYA